MMKTDAHRQGVARVRMDHPVQVRDRVVLVTEQRVVQRLAGGVFDVALPLVVGGDGVDRDPEDLRVSLAELVLQFRHLAELGRADRGEILRVRKEDPPTVAEVLVEIDLAFGRVRREVRRGVTELQGHGSPSANQAVFQPVVSGIRGELNGRF